MAHTPVRMCVACRVRRAQHELVRIALTPDGVRAGAAAHAPGRGAYVCPDPQCVERAVRRGGQAVRRALRADGTEVPDEGALVAVLTDAMQEQGVQVQLVQAKERSR